MLSFSEVPAILQRTWKCRFDGLAVELVWQSAQLPCRSLPPAVGRPYYQEWPLGVKGFLIVNGLWHFRGDVNLHHKGLIQKGLHRAIPFLVHHLEHFLGAIGDSLTISAMLLPGLTDQECLTFLQILVDAPRIVFWNLRRLSLNIWQTRVFASSAIATSISCAIQPWNVISS